MVILNCHQEPFVHLIIKKNDKDNKFRMFYSEDISDKFAVMKQQHPYNNVMAKTVAYDLFNAWV